MFLGGGEKGFFDWDCEADTVKTGIVQYSSEEGKWRGERRVKGEEGTGKLPTRDGGRGAIDKKRR